MMLCFGTSGIVSLLWALAGFSIAFGPSPPAHDVLGNGDYATLDNINPNTCVRSLLLACVASILFTLTPPIRSLARRSAPHIEAPTITLHTFATFQLFFAIIAAAIVCGAAAGKMKWA